MTIMPWEEDFDPCPSCQRDAGEEVDNWQARRCPEHDANGRDMVQDGEPPDPEWDEVEP